MTETLDIDATLLFAAETGDVSALAAALSAGANPNARRGPDGPTGLHLAAWQKNDDVVDILIKSGADETILCNGLTYSQLRRWCC